jgi:hypothetical protein
MECINRFQQNEGAVRQRFLGGPSAVLGHKRSGSVADAMKTRSFGRPNSCGHTGKDGNMQLDDNDIRRELLECLEYQRASARSIVGGLEEDAWHTPVVTSGWTVAGMVQHLGNVERHWFLEVVAGSDIDLPWDEGQPPYDPHMAFTCDRPSSDVLGYYREQCDRSDGILASVSLSDVPRGSHAGEEIPNVHVVLLHVIEETAAHTGHLEIAREILDGKTRLGLR